MLCWGGGAVRYKTVSMRDREQGFFFFFDWKGNSRIAFKISKTAISSQVKSSQVKLYCSISGNYAHNESSQKYKQAINRKTNYISMEI